MIEKKKLLWVIGVAAGLAAVALFPSWRALLLSRTRETRLGDMAVRGAKQDAERAAQRAALEVIQALLADGKQAEAAAALAQFERDHPECLVPEELAQVREALGR